jgi:hypothetical protein
MPLADSKLDARLGRVSSRGGPESLVLAVEMRAEIAADEAASE